MQRTVKLRPRDLYILDDTEDVGELEAQESDVLLAKKRLDVARSGGPERRGGR